MRKPSQANQGNQGNQAQRNTSIIKYVVNGMTSVEAIKKARNEIEAIEKNVFNIALLSAYSVGVTIPQYVDNKGVTHGEAKVEKPITRGDMLKEVGRSKQTLSRWLIAMELIIENKYFNDFAMLKYPFSYDKIITIFRNKEAFEGESLDDLMKMSACTLEAIVDDFKKSKDKPSEADGTSEATETSEADGTSAPTEATEEEPQEIKIVFFSYDGKKYKVEKSVFEKMMSSAELVIEE